MFEHITVYTWLIMPNNLFLNHWAFKKRNVQKDIDMHLLEVGISMGYLVSGRPCEWSTVYEFISLFNMIDLENVCIANTFLDFISKITIHAM